MNWAEHLIAFYKNLQPSEKLPNGIEWLHPQKEAATFEIAEKFFRKFYSDTQPRRIMLGINPGRFGAGVTGVNFTAPRQLLHSCGIEHPFKNTSELSAKFIYQVIDAYGGAANFYSDFFIGSVCPLGFIKNGKNINYYDDRNLQQSIEPFIVESISKLVSIRNYKSIKEYASWNGMEQPAQVSPDVCICIGGEKNFKYLAALNSKHNWFTRIIPLPHPRFIMQYRRKHIKQFIEQYLQFMTNE